ncbi:diguanylate cyclase [Acholeplasma equirhinis]|uniref:GGDEF domain-containing protein n=1 Tax=Acholeplasma equirhinis TaxID=555393 RepID=UPI00197AF007|nr:GGDEF domain-containing protein [Acholeplasma equirhinis]MBN3490723.1 diguanylate cyclase [Acholeplasma equirhinis]
MQLLLMNLSLFIYSIILLLAVLISNSKTKHQGTSDRLFSYLLITSIITLIFDFMSRFDGTAMAIFPFLNHLGNFLLFSVNPLLPVLWFMYIHYEIYSNDKILKRFMIASIPIFVFNQVLVFGTLAYGWLFHIDEGNIYQRGPLYLVPEFINLVIIIMTFLILIIARNRLIKSHFLMYLIFGLLPILALIAQSIHYGIPYTLHAITLSITILYIFVQNKQMKSDFLTNTFNRRQLDFYIEDRIKQAKRNGTFTAIFVDMDDFKQINDSYGHPVGDQALVNVAEIIKYSVEKNDFVARFGGDEFFIVTSKHAKKDIEAIIDKIQENIHVFNLNNPTYKLQASIGYCVYNKEIHPTLYEFQKEVDQLMYNQKHAKK